MFKLTILIALFGKPLEIDLNQSNLPSCLYDFIVIRCIDVDDEIDNNDDDKCQNLIDKIKCTCNNLVSGTEYKIIFITRQNNWEDAIFELPTNQQTSNLIS